MIENKFDIEWRDLNSITPYPQNARKITQSAIDKVALSIREFGWQQPIVVDAAGVIIIGHVRRLAALHLKLTQAPVHVAHGLSEAQIRALRLIDNRSHEEVEWDEAMLAVEMQQLRGLDIDLSFTGFDAQEINLLQPAQPDAKEDLTPAVEEAAVSRPGDIWRCGPHRLACGDACSPDLVAKLFASGRKPPVLMVTDPPYGVKYDAKWREKYDNYERHAVNKVANDDQIDWQAALHLFPGDVMYLWHASLFAGKTASSIDRMGWTIRAQIIWRKQQHVFSRGAYHWQHEPCWYAVRNGKQARWVGDRSQSTIWDVANLNPHGNKEQHGQAQEEITGHSTQKPVELMRRSIINHTIRGEAVYDPFLGSGTTLMACEVTERICYGLEIVPQYCDVIVRRWQNFTGQAALLDSDGVTFAHAQFGRRLGAEDAIKEEIFGQGLAGQGAGLPGLTNAKGLQDQPAVQVDASMFGV